MRQLWPFIGVLILVAIVAPAAGQSRAGRTDQAKSSKDAASAKQQSRQKPKQKRMPGVTRGREAAVMAFVREHHAELADLLLYLKSNQPKEYQLAVRDLFRTSERLAQMQERDFKRYELELALWKAQCLHWGPPMGSSSNGHIRFSCLNHIDKLGNDDPTFDPAQYKRDCRRVCMAMNVVIPNVLAYLEDELPPHKKRIFDMHLKMCRDCRDYLRAYKASMNLAKLALTEEEIAPLPDVPADLVRAVLASREAP